MTKGKKRPVLKNNVYSCKVCDSQDTIGLAKGDWYIIWCNCGLVTAGSSEIDKKEIFNFVEPQKKPYFTMEE